MVILSDVLDNLINKLNNDTHFKDVKIIKGYSYVTKPTRLSKAVLCVSLGRVDCKPCGIGDNKFYGDYIINLDVFSPYKTGVNAIAQIFKAVINNCKDNLPIAISTSEIESDAAALCYKARCSLAFNDLISTGGANYE